MSEKKSPKHLSVHAGLIILFRDVLLNLRDLQCGGHHQLTDSAGRRGNVSGSCQRLRAQPEEAAGMMQMVVAGFGAGDARFL